MNPGIRWTLKLTEQEARFHLPRIRHHADLQLCLQDKRYWVLWTDPDAQTEQLRLRWRGLALFAVDPEDRLIPLDHNLPHGKLPQGPWRTLEEWLPLESCAALPAPRVAPESCSLRLQRSVHIREATLLCCSLAEWARWLRHVPTAMLEGREFRVSQEGELWLRGGQRLPAIQGQRYSVEQGLALPLGFTVEPRLPASLIRRACGTSSSDLLVFHPEGYFIELSGEGWSPSSRILTAWAVEQCHG